MTTPCYVYEFTLPKRDLGVDGVHDLLRSHCKSYTFQLERGEQTGYEHYQGRLSLFKKKRAGQTALCFPDTGIHITPTSANALQGEAFYCMKADSRIEGPWTDKDYKPPKRKLKCIELMKEKGLYPWQSDIISKLENYDPRTIHVVIDPNGNNGKTYCMKWLVNECDAMLIPPMESCEDLIGFAMSFPYRNMYVIDMPRSMPKKRLFGFYAGIETLKNGILYDKRYHGKFLLMDEPGVLVFTNVPPKKRYLSADRWKLWTIKNNELHVFTYGYDFQPPKRNGVSEEPQEEEGV